LKTINTNSFRVLKKLVFHKSLNSWQKQNTEYTFYFLSVKKLFSLLENSSNKISFSSLLCVFVYN